VKVKRGEVTSIKVRLRRGTRKERRKITIGDSECDLSKIVISPHFRVKVQK